MCNFNMCCWEVFLYCAKADTRAEANVYMGMWRSLFSDLVCHAEVSERCKFFYQSLFDFQMVKTMLQRIIDCHLKCVPLYIIVLHKIFFCFLHNATPILCKLKILQRHTLSLDNVLPALQFYLTGLFLPKSLVYSLFSAIQPFLS